MKRIVFDVSERTEYHRQSGSTYVIDRRLQRFEGGICVDRNFVLHDTIAGMRSFLLPDRNLWIKFFEGHAGPAPIHCYIDMARIVDAGERITVEDLYLDVLVLPNGKWRLLDVDEFRLAIAGGDLSPAQVQAALLGLEHASRLVDQHGLQLEEHLQKSLACV